MQEYLFESNIETYQDKVKTGYKLEKVETTEKDTKEIKR